MRVNQFHHNAPHPVYTYNNVLRTTNPCPPYDVANTKPISGFRVRCDARYSGPEVRCVRDSYRHFRIRA